jgi:hypothetical protein
LVPFCRRDSVRLTLHFDLANLEFEVRFDESSDTLAREFPNLTPGLTLWTIACSDGCLYGLEEQAPDGQDYVFCLDLSDPFPSLKRSAPNLVSFLLVNCLLLLDTLAPSSGYGNEVMSLEPRWASQNIDFEQWSCYVGS